MTQHELRQKARFGRTLKLYLVDGTASGVITGELGVSSLRAAVASRTSLPDLVRREEAGETGIYLLVGPDPSQPDRNLVYVGEGDQVRTRLIAHDSDETKDFFTRAVFIVSKDENLTKAHGRYLESRIISAIRTAGRATLKNGTEPPFRGLPEPEIADMERVLEEIEILLPVLGFDLLRPAGQGAIDTKLTKSIEENPTLLSADQDIFVFNEAGTDARAREGSGEFVVLEGSLARATEVNSCDDGVKRARHQLIADGTLAASPDPKLLRFTRDAAFGSPSRAACVVYGGSVSGPAFWRHKTTGQIYRDWRAQRIAAQDN